MGAEPGQGQDGAVNHQHHDGTVQGQGALGLDKQAVKAVRCLLELLILVGLPDEGLDHPDGRHVLLNAGVQVVIPAEYLLKDRDGPGHDEDEGHPQHHQRHQKDRAQLDADEKAHAHGADQHQRSPDGDAKDHLIGVLHVGHIGGHTGDQPGGAVLVDVGKREGLHLGVEGVPQVAGKAGGSLGGKSSGQGAEAQAQKRHDNHQSAIAVDLPQIAGLNALVDDGGGDKGDEQLHHHLQGGEQRRQQRRRFVLFDLA